MSWLLAERIQKMTENQDKQSIETINNPIVITGAQDFKSDKAYVAIAVKEQEGYEFKETVLLIDSDKDKLVYSPPNLYSKSIIAERKPLPESFRWEKQNLDLFLGGENVVSIASVHNSIVEQSKKYLHFSNQSWHELIGLWIIGTYFHRMFPSYPYIHLNGNAHSGKTKCLAFIANLAFNAEMSFNNTAAYMVRLIHDNSATCCMDEVESLRRAKDEDSKVLLAMLNSGYKRGSFSGKMELQKLNNWTRAKFESYSPKVLAGIDTLPTTLGTRCIPIIMQRSANQEIVNREINELDPFWVEIRNNLYRSLLSHFQLIGDSYAELEDKDILGRSWELWKPILSIAKCVSEDTYIEAKSLAMEVEANKKEIETEQILTPILLQALYELMLGRNETENFYPLSAICEFLSQYDIEAFGWLADERQKNRRGKWLMNQLRIAGIVNGKAEQKKIHNVNNKGCTLNRDKIAELMTSFGVTVPSSDVKLVKFQSMDEMVDSIPF